MLDRVTAKKTIPGLRTMVEQIESNKLLDAVYVKYRAQRISEQLRIADETGR